MAQIGTIKIETSSGSVEVPVFEISDVGYPVVRVQTSSGVGAINLVDPVDAELDYLRVQTSNGVKAVSNSLPPDPTISGDYGALALNVSGQTLYAVYRDDSGNIQLQKMDYSSGSLSVQNTTDISADLDGQGINSMSYNSVQSQVHVGDRGSQYNIYNASDLSNASTVTRWSSQGPNGVDFTAPESSNEDFHLVTIQNTPVSEHEVIATLDSSTHSMIDSIDGSNFSERPLGGAMNPDGSEYYAGGRKRYIHRVTYGSSGGSLSKTSYQVPSSESDDIWWRAMDIDSSGDYLYAAGRNQSSANGYVIKLRLSDHTVVGQYDGLPDEEYGPVNSAGNLVVANGKGYVYEDKNNTVHVFNLSDMSQNQVIDPDAGSAYLGYIGVDPSQSILFVAGSNSLRMINV